MDKEAVVKLALTGLAATSTAARSENAPPPPRPIEEICKIVEATEDGIGLDQDILDFLIQLESQGRILECSTLYAEEDMLQEWPTEDAVR